MTVLVGMSGKPVPKVLMSVQVVPELIVRKTCMPPPLKPPTLTSTVAALIGEIAIWVIGTKEGRPDVMSV